MNKGELNRKLTEENGKLKVISKEKIAKLKHQLANFEIDENFRKDWREPDDYN